MEVFTSFSLTKALKITYSISMWLWRFFKTLDTVDNSFNEKLQLKVYEKLIFCCLLSTIRGLIHFIHWFSVRLPCHPTWYANLYNCLLFCQASIWYFHINWVGFCRIKKEREEKVSSRGYFVKLYCQNIGC